MGSAPQLCPLPRGAATPPAELARCQSKQSPEGSPAGRDRGGGLWRRGRFRAGARGGGPAAGSGAASWMPACDGFTLGRQRLAGGAAIPCLTLRQVVAGRRDPAPRAGALRRGDHQQQVGAPR